MKITIYPVAVHIGLKWPLGKFVSLMLLLGVFWVIIRLYRIKAWFSDFPSVVLGIKVSNYP